jgi:anti-anti-sigma factor
VNTAGESRNMLTNIIYLTDSKDENIDYNSILIKVMGADVMDLNNSGNMLIFLKTLITGGAKKILLDMNGLEFIDSSGISVLIETAKLIRQKNGDIALSNVPQWIQKILEPFKLNLFINIYNSQDEVIKFFKMV